MPEKDAVVARNQVRSVGAGPPLLLAHGFGCAQDMWRGMIPELSEEHTVITYDLTGMGKSDTTAYDLQRHGTLEGHARDAVEIVEALGLTGVTFVGHSVSSIIGVLASNMRPDLISRLVMIVPSPCYLNLDDYPGGFSREDIEGLLAAMDDNYIAWSQQFAPVVMGTPEEPKFEEELTQRFCLTDPTIARHFARVTFLGDNRADLSKVTVPTLVLQSHHDSIAPPEVIDFVRRAIKGSDYAQLDSHGHCPNLSSPKETSEAILKWLGTTVRVGHP